MLSPQLAGAEMQRREFVGLIGIGVTWPLLANAQPAGKVPVIGILWHGSAEREWANPFYHYVHDGLASHGYVAGKTVRYEERYANEKLVS